MARREVGLSSRLQSDQVQASEVEIVLLQAGGSGPIFLTSGRQADPFGGRRTNNDARETIPLLQNGVIPRD